MKDLTLFLSLALTLVAGVLLVLCRALWRASRQQHQVAVDPARANAEVYREQLAELEREYAQGTLSAQSYQQTRDELTRRLLEDVQTPRVPGVAAAVMAPSRWVRTTLASFVVVIPVATLLAYGVLGQPAGLDPAALAQSEPHEAVDPKKMAEMVEKLERRLLEDPNQLQGWVMLGRVRRAMGQFEAAGQAYAKALALSSDDDVAIERAEVLAQAKQGSFEGEPWKIIEAVLRANPDQLSALLLAGSAAYSEGRYEHALKHWQRARTLMAADAPDLPPLEEALAQVRGKLGLAASAAPATPQVSQAPATTASPSASASRITGVVQLAASVKAKVAPTDTVFIYATPADGTRMPLAIVRTTVAALPYAFTLDDSSAMTQANLSSVAQVTLRARISKTGEARAQPGDLGVVLTPVKTGAQGVQLTIEGEMR
ncbi:MAG: Cytochrome c-type biosis protein CcmH precursor [Pseudomonadota bacterium]